MRNLAGLRLLIAALVIIVIAQAGQAGDWPMFRHDAARSGMADEVVKPPLKLLWKYQVDSSYNNLPVVSGGILYLVTVYNDGNKGYIYALDISTGSLKWKYQIDGIYSSPAVSDGAVYVGMSVDTNDGYIYALDSITGSLKWKYKIGHSLSSPAVSGGVVYIGSQDGYLYALDTATGNLKWKYPTGSAIPSSPAVSGGVVYVGSPDGYLYALDASTGSLKWKYKTDFGYASSPAVSGGVVYFKADRSSDFKEGSVYALDANTGSLKWKYNTRNSFVSDPAVSGSMVYVVGEVSSQEENSIAYTGRKMYGAGGEQVYTYYYLYALDASTGSLKWKYKTDWETSSPVISGDVVYVDSQDGFMYAFDASTGSLKWKYQTGYEWTSSPVVSGGLVWLRVGNYVNSYVYGLAPSDGSTSGDIPIIPISTRPLPQQQESGWGFISGIISVLVIGIFIVIGIGFLYSRRIESVPRPAHEQTERDGSDILDEGYVLSKKASSLFNIKDYYGALETYSRALEKFFIARKDAKGDASLAKSIENNIISSRKNILACKFALGIGISEAAKSAFDEERCEDAEKLYKEAIEHFEGALKDAEELEDADEINKLQSLISKTRSNINSCYIAADKKKVEELSERADNLLKEAVKFRENMELSKARDMLKKAESVIEAAFDIATKREEFEEAQQILSKFLANVREERNKVDKLQIRPIDIVKREEKDILKVISSKPDIKSPVEKITSESAELEIKRGYEVLDNQDLQFGILVKNISRYTVNDVDVILRFDRSLFSIKNQEFQHLGNITKNGEKTARYTLTPLVGCVHHSEINAIITYKDASNIGHTVQMRPKEVHCISPFLAEKPMTEGQFSKLYENHSCLVKGIIFKGIGSEAITNFIIDSSKNKRFVVNNSFVNEIRIIYLSSEAKDNSYYLLTVIIRNVDGLPHIALKACSNNEGGINNFIEEILSSLRHYVNSVQSAREVENIVNKSIQIIKSHDVVVSLEGDAYGRDESFNYKSQR